MKRLIIYIVLLCSIDCLQAQRLFPSDFTFRIMNADSIDTLLNTNAMRSNVVTEVVLQGDKSVWLGTGLGISIIRDSITVETLQDTLELTNGAYTSRLPIGGISAMTTGDKGSSYDKFMFAAVAGSEMISQLVKELYLLQMQQILQ